jgi:hypothetical protein
MQFWGLYFDNWYLSHADVTVMRVQAVGRVDYANTIDEPTGSGNWQLSNKMMPPLRTQIALNHLCTEVFGVNETVLYKLCDIWTSSAVRQKYECRDKEGAWPEFLLYDFVQ